MADAYQVLRYQDVTNYNRDEYSEDRHNESEDLDLGLFESLELAKTFIEKDKEKEIKAIFERGEEAWVRARDPNEGATPCEDETAFYLIAGILYYNCYNDDITTIRYYVRPRQIKGLA